MTTNLEEFIRQRKTRIEALEDRITNADQLIKELNRELNEEGEKEIEQLTNVLNELKQIKENLKLKEEQEDMILDSEMEQIKKDSLLILNIDKIRIVKENENYKRIHSEKDEGIKNLQIELRNKILELELTKKKEQDLIDKTFILEDQIRLLKSKAYGYDIAKKFEIHHNQLNKKDDVIRNKIEDEKLAYSFWEKENYASSKNPSQLDQLSKHRQLWISNPTANISKLIHDIHTGENKNKMKKDDLTTNMRKYSNFIMDTKG